MSHIYVTPIRSIISRQDNNTFHIVWKHQYKREIFKNLQKRGNIVFSRSCAALTKILLQPNAIKINRYHRIIISSQRATSNPSIYIAKKPTRASPLKPHANLSQLSLSPLYTQNSTPVVCRSNVNFTSGGVYLPTYNASARACGARLSFSRDGDGRPEVGLPARRTPVSRAARARTRVTS